MRVPSLSRVFRCKLLSLKYKVIDKPLMVMLAVQTKLTLAIKLRLNVAAEVRPAYSINASET